MWVDHKDTQVVGTCWAAMALMYAKYPDPAPIANAVRLVMSRQLPVRVISRFGAARCLLTVVAGWLVAARGDRGRVQQELRDLVP